MLVPHKLVFNELNSETGSALQHVSVTEVFRMGISQKRIIRRPFTAFLSHFFAIDYPAHACASRGYVIGSAWCQYLPTRASEQGNVIGSVRLYVCTKKNCKLSELGI